MSCRYLWPASTVLPAPQPAAVQEQTDDAAMTARHSAKRNSEAKTQGRSSVVTGPAHCWAPGGTANQASNASSRCSKVEQQKAEKPSGHAATEQSPTARPRRVDPLKSGCRDTKHLRHHRRAAPTRRGHGPKRKSGPGSLLGSQAAQRPLKGRRAKGCTAAGGGPAQARAGEAREPLPMRGAR